MGQPGKSSAAHSWHPPKPQASSPPNIVKDRERVTRIVDGVPHAVTDFSILFCVVLAGLPNKSLFN